MSFKERALNLRITEDFLLGQVGVVDASVWVDSGSLHAHVTLHDDAECNALELQDRCAAHIGADCTPSAFVVIHGNRRAG